MMRAIFALVLIVVMGVIAAKLLMLAMPIFAGLVLASGVYLAWYTLKGI